MGKKEHIPPAHLDILTPLYDLDCSLIGLGELFRYNIVGQIMILMKETGFSNVEVLGETALRDHINRGEKGVIICRAGICNLCEFMLKLRV